MQPVAQLARDRSGHAGVCRYLPLKYVDVNILEPGHLVGHLVGNKAILILV